MTGNGASPRSGAPASPALATANVPRRAATDSGVQYCTFEVVDLLVGIDIRNVQEVLPEQRMATVPLSPSSVSGLINLRGQIVAAIDLRTRLGLPPRPTGVRAMNAVVRHGTEVVSLIVDRTRDVVEPSTEEYEPVPQTASLAIRQLTTGTFKLQNRLLLILDIGEVLRVTPDNVGSYRYPEWVSDLDVEDVIRLNGG